MAKAKILKVKNKTKTDSVVSRTVENVQEKIKRKAKFQESTDAKLKVRQARKEGKKLRKEKYLKELGVLYLSHIPHGFYEEQLKKFFGQFGRVVKVQLARSTLSGRSKGYAFIVFRFKEVAEIAAETANNYLMGKRILKAKVIPYEEVKPKWFWYNAPSDCRKTFAAKRREKVIQHLNKKLTPQESKKRLLAHKKSVKRMMMKLKEKGINVDYETS